MSGRAVTLSEVRRWPAAVDVTQAAQALGRIGPEAMSALPALVALLDDSAVSVSAGQALAQLGPEAVKHAFRELELTRRFNRPGLGGERDARARS